MVNLFTYDIWPDPAISDTIQDFVSRISPSLKSDYSTEISKIDNKDCSFSAVSKNDNYSVSTVGDDNTLDIITWNMERFPLKGDSTMKAVAEIILDLDVDIIGVQEVIKIGNFAKIVFLRGSGKQLPFETFLFTHFPRCQKIRNNKSRGYGVSYLRPRW